MIRFKLEATRARLEQLIALQSNPGAFANEAPELLARALGDVNHLLRVLPNGRLTIRGDGDTFYE